jgi:hypothetical protein
MSEISSFGNTAKGFARNPLGIIALFIVLIYGFAALTLGFNSKLEAAERLPLVWFLVAFPVAVLVLFGWLVSSHHEKLYAPSDFRSDDVFLKRAQTQRHTAELLADGEELKKRIREMVVELARAKSAPNEVAERVAKEIEEATTFTVDASAFLGRSDAVFSYPIAAFETLGNLTDEVYFKLSSKVGPYQYGSTWVLKDRETSEILRTLRMLTGTPAGKPLPDPRSLREVGVKPGNILIVEQAHR